MVQAELVDGRIHVTFPYNANLVNLAKSIGGGKYLSPEKGGPAWSYPLSISNCRTLRAAFKSSLKVGKELNAWAREEIKREDEMIALAASMDAQLTHVPKLAPKLAAAMETRAWQAPAALFGARAGSFGNFDQPGLGKTIETLGAIVEGSRTGCHLIFAPKVAVGNVWAPEIKRWLGERADAFPLLGDKATRTELLRNALSWKTSAAHVFVIANIEMSRIVPVEGPSGKRDKFLIPNADYPDLFAIEWDTIVVDESHRALIRLPGVPSQQRAGFIRLKAKKRIALSGTPMRGKPEQRWGTLNWIRPDLYTSYWVWVAKYFDISSDAYSDFVLGKPLPDGLDRMYRDDAAIIIRRTKEEVGMDPKLYVGTHLLPADDNSPYGVWLEPSEKHAKQYAKFAEDSSLDFGDAGEIIANYSIEIAVRQKQLASAVHTMVDGKLTPTLDSPKYEWLLMKLEELGIAQGEDDAKIVIASQFTRLINVFAAGLRAKGIPCHVLTGETSDRKRAAIIEDFQSEHSEARVFFLNTKAGGVAVTLDAADYLVLLDETKNPDDQEQVEDRIHRTSRKHNVMIHYLRTLGTIDEEIAWVAAARYDTTKYLLDGARGINYARALYESAIADLAQAPQK